MFFSISFLFRQSLTAEQINVLNLESQQRSLFVNRIDSSRAQTTAQLTQNPKTITASVPHQPQLNTTVKLPQNLIDKSNVTVQAEYQRKGSPIEEEEFITVEPPPRRDYGKKILVCRIVSFDKEFMCFLVIRL